MELIGRMMDGSFDYDPGGRLEPVSGGPGTRQEDTIDRLRGVPLFAEYSTKQLRSLAKITKVVDVAAGTAIARAGEPGDEFSLISDGSVRVEVPPDQHVLLGPGKFFGEMSLLDGGPRSATVVAHTPVRLLVISRRNFSVLLREVPDLIETLLITLSRRVRLAEERAERLASGAAGS